MIICMRTTLVLDDALLRQARKRAAERGMTVSDIVNEALRGAFREPPPTPTPFTMITFGKESRRVNHTPADFADELEQEEIARLG